MPEEVKTKNAKTIVTKNPLSEKKMLRLVETILANRDRMEKARIEQLDMIDTYMGIHVGDNNKKDKTPINLFEEEVTILSSFIVSQNPSVMVNTIPVKLKSDAYTMQLEIKRALDEIGFADTFQALFRDSLFGIACVKTGIARLTDVEIEGTKHDVGQFFADPVNLDDLVIDMKAKDISRLKFAGDRFQLPLEYVKNSKMFTNTEGLGRTEDTVTNKSGDERIKELHNTRSTDEDLVDMIEMWNIYLYEYKVMLTLPVDRMTEPIRVVKWDGPEQGPYDFLLYNPIPNTPMPIPPLTLVKDLQNIVSILFNRLARQAERQKTFTVVGVGAVKDGIKEVEVADGGVITSVNPAGTTEKKSGGIDPQTFGFVLQVLNLFNKQSGNLEALGGLGQQADTATQEQLITSGASRRVKAMQQKVMALALRVIKSMVWYKMNDPLMESHVVKRSGDLEVPVTFSPETMEADFIDFNFEIVPTSMEPRSPESDFSKLSLFADKAIQLQPFLQMEGTALSARKILSRMAKLLNIEDYAEEIFVDGVANPGEAEVVEAGKPPHTITENIRTNVRGGASETEKNNALIQQAFAGSENKAVGVGGA